MNIPSGYFDYAAATPVDDEVLRVMQSYHSDCFFNPSSQYTPGRQAKKALDDARAVVAETLGVKPVTIIFTAGATEANNLAIHGVMQQFPDATIAVSAVEHDSVLRPAQRYGHVILPVDAKGMVQLDELQSAIDDTVVMMSVIYANNEIGTVQQITKIGQKIEHIRREREAAGNTLPLYFHIDATQAANYLDIHPHRLGVDMMTLGGGKIYGPKQSGCLYVRSGVRLQPVLQGGGQESGLRSGTENVPAIIGFAHALQKAQALRREEVERLSMLQRQLLQGLEQFALVQVNGHPRHRLPNNVHITCHGYDNERLTMQLDMRSMYVATGSACSASHDDPSHVLAAIGLDDQAAQSSIRMTMGRGTDETAVQHLTEVLAELLAGNR